MNGTRAIRRLLAALAAASLAACAAKPGTSHVSSPYRGKLPDDTLVEASTTVLVTKRDVVIALDCARLAKDDAQAIDRAVTAGEAARLPAGVTVYTPPFSARNPRRAPLVVTDDKYAGTLCTPDSYDVVGS